MSKLPFFAALLTLVVLLACGGEDATPAPGGTEVRQPVAAATLAPEPTAAPAATLAPTVTPTDTPEPTPAPTATPAPATSHTSEPESMETRDPEAMPLAPLPLDAPMALAEELPESEFACLSDAAGSDDPVEVFARLEAASVEEVRLFVDCLGRGTLLRVYLTSLFPDSGPLSMETSVCIRHGITDDILREIPEVGSIEGEIAGLTGFMVFTSCLNDEEWETAAQVLHLGPRDRESTDCFIAELGADGIAEALVSASESGLPDEFIAAMGKCGEGLMMQLGGQHFGEEPAGVTLSGEMTDGDIDDLLSALTSGEAICLSGNGLGPLELMMLTGKAPIASEETVAATVDCLNDYTVTTIFLMSLTGLSFWEAEEIAECFGEEVSAQEIRQVMAPPGGERNPALGLAIGQRGYVAAMACMEGTE